MLTPLTTAPPPGSTRLRDRLRRQWVNGCWIPRRRLLRRTVRQVLPPEAVSWLGSEREATSPLLCFPHASPHACSCLMILKTAYYCRMRVGGGDTPSQTAAGTVCLPVGTGIGCALEGIYTSSSEAYRRRCVLVNMTMRAIIEGRFALR